MNKNIITEVVEFNIVSGISDKEFIKIVDSLEKNFHSQQKGFIDTELVKGKDDRKWLMIQHWSSMDDLMEASRIMFKVQITEQFRQAIDPKSVKMSMLEQVGKWNK